MDRKGNIYFIFFKSAQALIKEYEKFRQITTRLQSNDFCGIFRATHHEILHNACIRLKKIQFVRNFPKMTKILLAYFQKQSSGGFLQKRCSWEFAKFT